MGGLVSKTVIYTQEELDKTIQTGIYKISEIESFQQSNGILIVFKMDDSRIVQFFVKWDGTFYTRVFWVTKWGSWTGYLKS